MQTPKIIQLTHTPIGHTLNNSQVFSADNQWLVFDTRNNDGDIQITGSIGIVNIITGEECIVYTVPNQGKYGPGVGAASFSPIEDKVVFIHGIRNADIEKPYHSTRRTGVAIAINKPHQLLFMDARDVYPPFTSGALRGGTHAHSWSSDGQMISFTYNDFIIEQLAKNNSSIRDLRTIGLMFPRKVSVSTTETLENNDGEMFSVVAATVTENPQPGSNEIDKAFDECWIGTQGYLKPDGTIQKRAIAFQGNTKDERGDTITEIFVADIQDDLSAILNNANLSGTSSTRPLVPKEITQRRITFSIKGVKGPRHWLRSNPKGNQIYFLSEDEKNIVQVYAVSPNGGDIKQITFNTFSIQGPINLSPDGQYLSYLADGSVCISHIENGTTIFLSPKYEKPEYLTGAVLWSNDGRYLSFNRYIKDKTGVFLQIFLIQNPV